MLNALLIALGGALGSLARYGISLIYPWHYDGFPWATFISNCLASLILGLTAGIILQKFSANHGLRFFMIIGFCGGFSTFSSFAFELFKLNQNEDWNMALIYTLSSVILSVGFIFGGFSLANNLN